jgi:hypothetical protein
MAGRSFKARDGVGIRFEFKVSFFKKVYIGVALLLALVAKDTKSRRGRKCYMKIMFCSKLLGVLSEAFAALRSSLLR